MSDEPASLPKFQKRELVYWGQSPIFFQVKKMTQDADGGWTYKIHPYASIVYCGSYWVRESELRQMFPV